MKKYLLGMAMWAGAAPLWAGGIDLALSNETAYLSVILNRDPFLASSVGNRAQDGGAEIAVGGFISEADDKLVHGTLMARGVRQTADSQTHISAGMKLIGGEIEAGPNREDDGINETVGALALGFQAGLLLQQSAYNPVELSFEGFYAPNITSFSDAERFGEVSVRLQVEIMPRARAYIGYRRMRFDTNDYEDVQLDRAAHVGLNISF